MFAEMSEGYKALNFNDPHVDFSKTVTAFLARFDAIYTLNQDTLIEQKFDGSLSKRLITLPGIKSAKERLTGGRGLYPLYTPDQPSSFTVQQQSLPYIKLHGSIDWIYGDRELLLILGGNKEENIRKLPLLRWYHDGLFRADLRKPNTRLMIIGYSFSDNHINKEILNAITQSDLRLFIIDPKGVDVLDNRDPETVARASVSLPPTELMEQLSPRVIGASKRPLTTTFGGDLVEHAKVMRFFG